MKVSGDLKDFESRLGYAFKDAELLIRALTHPSISSEARPDNQRLEFLGDRVLGLAIAEAVLTADEVADEGTLAPRLNALVRKETCAEVAREIDLGAVLRLGRSETMSGGRKKTALLGDGMEAVIAAVYLDGGYEAARDLVLRLWGNRISTVKADARDPKTALQEWAQARGHGTPAYVEVSRAGPDHAPEFTIEARVTDELTSRATGGSKRQAEQEAARSLLEQVSQ